MNLSSLPPRVKEVIRGFLPPRIRPHRIRRGRVAGLTICTSWRDYPGAILGSTEEPLLAWFARHVKPGETWLDIGAHYGYTAIALAGLTGRAGRVFAFEPVLRTAQCAARTRDLNGMPQIEILPFGLTAEGGIRPRSLPLVRGMADSTAGEETARESILVTSFDHLWPSLCAGNPAVHGVKIDVQGMEAEVLAGMSEMLRAFRPHLVIEFHKGVNSQEILDFLESCGYPRGHESLETGVFESRAATIEPDRSYAFQAA